MPPELGHSAVRHTGSLRETFPEEKAADESGGGLCALEVSSGFQGLYNKGQQGSRPQT